MGKLLDHFYVVGTASSVILGFLMALVVFRFGHGMQKRRTELAWLLVVLALSVAVNSLLHVFLIKSYPLVRSLSDPFQLLIGPLLLLYLNKLNRIPKNGWNTVAHLIPFIFSFGYLLTVLLRKESLNNNINWVGFATYIQFWVYFGLCYRSLKKYRSQLKLSQSNIEKINESWVQQSLLILLISYTGVTLLYVLNHGIYYLPVNKSLAIILATVMYLVVYKTLRRPEVYIGGCSLKEGHLNDHKKEQCENEEDKYQKSSLKNLDIDAHFEQLKQLMIKSKPYTNPDLSLQMLATELSLSPHHLSQIINHANQANFYDFVNSYRIEEVKRRLSNSNDKDTKLITIAFDSGFNSKATFNRIFKNLVHRTPSDYRRHPS